MNKSVIIALLIFIVPLLFYWGLTKNQTISVLPSEASNKPVIIKFASPMCYECQELEKIFEEVYPKHSSRISLVKINVAENSIEVDKLIKKYEVTLVPTTIFKDKNGSVTRRIEGMIQPKILENYIKEIDHE